MSTEVRIHELYLPATIAERLENAQRRQLLQDLPADQQGILIRICKALGSMLITRGEALRQQTNVSSCDVTPKATSTT